MKRSSVLLLLPLACSTFGIPVSEVADSRTLLPAEKMVSLAASSPKRIFFSDQTPFWDPSAAELEICESKLRAYWGSRRYDIQYFGTTENGKRVLRVHGWCAGRIPLEELSSFPVFTMDAGRCHFTGRCKAGTWPSSSLHFSTRGPGG
jgi:hypothetical protein